MVIRPVVKADARGRAFATLRNPSPVSVAELALAADVGGEGPREPSRQQLAYKWGKLMLPGLSATTVLIVGLGAIGSRVAHFARAFGMTVHGIRRARAGAAGVDRQGTLSDLAAFLPEADFVVLALPISDDTAGMIDRAALARMKDTAVLVNVGRGALVDIDALREALGSGGIASAFLDVLPVEPWPATATLGYTVAGLKSPQDAVAPSSLTGRVADGARTVPSGCSRFSSHRCDPVQEVKKNRHGSLSATFALGFARQTNAPSRSPSRGSIQQFAQPSSLAVAIS